MTDEELDRALKSWHLPAIPLELERRTAAAYREEFQKPRGLKRWLTMRVHVPVPALAAAALVGALLSIALGIEVQRVRSIPQAVQADDFVPVTTLQPRIIRSSHAPRN
jgi:hypothetical protein